MRRSPHHPRSRGGFTLVELLVVITIIAILLGLATAAMFKFIGKGDELKLRNEITQLANAVAAFKTHYQVSYIPDRIVLREDGQYGTNPDPILQALERATISYLSSLWPRMAPTIGTNPGEYHDWNNNGVRDNGFIVLEGHQCLVFFLGGMRPGNANNCIGFSTNAKYPEEVTSQGSRAGPFYEFAPDRLTRNFSGAPTNPPSYFDVYGIKPFLYFSTGRSTNNYNATYSGPLNQLGVLPYQVSSVQFANPSGFQIISAGKDGLFGPGGLAWAGATGGSVTAEGADDVANFHPTFLGTPGQ